MRLMTPLWEVLHSSMVPSKLKGGGREALEELTVITVGKKGDEKPVRIVKI